MNRPVIPEADALAEAVRDLQQTMRVWQIPALRDCAAAQSLRPG